MFLKYQFIYVVFRFIKNNNCNTFIIKTCLKINVDSKKIRNSLGIWNTVLAVWTSDGKCMLNKLIVEYILSQQY